MTTLTNYHYSGTSQTTGNIEIIVHSYTNLDDETTQTITGDNSININDEDLCVASIDIGTNSTHLLVAQINSDLTSFNIKSALLKLIFPD